MRLVLFVFSACSVCSIFSCDVDRPRWTFRFDSAATASATMIIRARILEGGCEGRAVLYEVELDGDVPEPGPPRLEPGRYGFAGEAFDQQCTVAASGCETIELPRSSEFVVSLSDGPGTARCPVGTCASGRCDDNAVVEVAAGRAHSCAATFGGSVWCWGRNETGQVGDGSRTDTPLPVLVASNLEVGALAAGGILTNWQSHSCLVDRGTLLCWGYNAQGQLGDETTTQRLRPVPVSLTSVFALSAGGRHTCAATDDGSVWCWGDNDFGQLGLSAGGQRSSPHLVEGISNVVQVCAGRDHTCVRRFTGAVLCWGRNSAGQLGTGDTDMSSSPEHIVNGAHDIACGAAHTCAVMIDGTVSCWGDNESGQVGQDGVEPVVEPRIVSGIDDAEELALGFRTSCVRHTTGTVSCWGDNRVGQLGVGEPGPSTPTPSRVVGIDDALDITYGSDHGCVIRANGELWCWGRNQWGRLGDGTTEDRPTPRHIQF